MKNKQIIILLLVLIGLGAGTIGFILHKRKKEAKQNKLNAPDTSSSAQPSIEVAYINQDKYELDVAMRYQGIADTLKIRNGVLPNKQYGTLTFKLESLPDTIVATIMDGNTKVLEKTIVFDAYLEEVQTVKSDMVYDEIVEVNDGSEEPGDKKTKMGGIA